VVESVKVELVTGSNFARKLGHQHFPFHCFYGVVSSSFYDKQSATEYNDIHTSLWRTTVSKLLIAIVGRYSTKVQQKCKSTTRLSNETAREGEEFK
jgi:hypothetical protein